MFNLVSLIIGAVALLFALIAFLPFLGWANWLIIPLAIIGAGSEWFRAATPAATSICS
jgi:hypothetical protein